MSESDRTRGFAPIRLSDDTPANEFVPAEYLCTGRTICSHDDVGVAESDREDLAIRVISEALRIVAASDSRSMLDCALLESAAIICEQTSKEFRGAANSKLSPKSSKQAKRKTRRK